MNNITYENQGNNTYLVYEITDADQLDSLSLGMINNNKIAGLAPVIYTQVDSKKYLKYNITAKVAASTFLSGTTSKNRVLGVLSGITKALLSAEEYMLDANNIMLDLEYIFVDVTTCESELICLPIQRGNSNDVLSFFKNIVFSVTYDQTENCDYVAKIISCLNSHSSFSLVNFMQTIDELNGKRINIQELSQSQQLVAARNENMAQQSVSQPQSQLAPQPQQQPTAPVQPAMSVQPARPAQPVVQQPMMQQPQPMQNQMPPQGRPGMPPQGMPGVPPQGRPGMPPQGMPGMAPQGKPAKLSKKDIKKKEKEAPQQMDYSVPGAPKMPGRPGVPPQGRPGMPPQGRPGMPPQQAKQPVKKKGFLDGLFHKKDKAAPTPGNMPQNIPGQQPGFRPGNMPQNIPGQQPGFRPGNMPQNIPGQQPGFRPGNMPQNMTGQQPVNQSMQPAMSAGKMQPVQQPQQMQVEQPTEQRYMNFGETTVLGSNVQAGETSVLSAPVETQPYLIRKKNGEQIFITGAMFRIGKERNYVDYFIGDNSAISRSHANIVLKGTDYYVIDTNSKNHTYVNGQMIPSNEEVKLNHGMVLKLANEEFEFRVY